MGYITNFPPVVGTPGVSKAVLSSDSAEGLAIDVKFLNGQQDGGPAITVVIYVEVADIRIAYGVSPNPSLPFGYPVRAGQYLVLDKWAEVDTIQHIADVANTEASLTITGYF